MSNSFWSKKATAKVCKGFFFLALAGGPCIFWPHLFEPLEAQKALFIRLCLIVALGSATLVYRKLTVVDFPVVLLMIVIIAWLSLSFTAHAANREAGLVTEDWILALLGVVLAAHFSQGKAAISGLNGSLIGVLIVLSIFGFFQKYGPAAWHVAPSHQMVSTFNHPNLFAQYALLVFPLLAGLIFTADSHGKWLSGYLLFGAATLPFVLTYARGALLALLASLAGFTLAAFIAAGRRRKTLFQGALMLGLVLGLLLISWSFDQPSRKRAHVLSPEPQQQISSLKNRYDLWEQGYHAIREAPWFGCGPGQTMGCLAHYRQSDFAEKRWQHRDVHQDLMQLALEFGVPFLLCYLALVFRLLQLALRRFHALPRGSNERIHLLSFLFCFAAFFLHGLIDFPISRVVPRLYALAFLGMAAGPQLVEWRETSRPPKWPVRLVGGLLILAFLAILLSRGVIDEAFSMWYVRQARVAAKQSDPATALAACEPILKDRGQNYLRRSTCITMTKKWLRQESLPYLDELVLDFPENYKAASFRGFGYLSNGRPAIACFEVDRAMWLWPRNPKWKRLLRAAERKSSDKAQRRYCQKVEQRRQMSVAETNELK